MINIIEAKDSHYDKIYQLHTVAFGRENESLLIEKLKKDTTVFIPQLSLIAIKENDIVGHILFTKVKIVNKEIINDNILALAPIAVLPELQRKGIGSELINKGLMLAKNLGFDAVIVLGDPAYYGKFGFLKTSLWKISAPFDDVPEAFFMARELKAGILNSVSGVVKYPQAFKEV